LDVKVEEGGPGGSFDNTPEGIVQLATFCRQHQVHLVAMEASGGYEKLPFALLNSEGIAVAMVDPRSVRRFSQAMRYLEKTDAIDAGDIAHFARAKKSKPCSPGSTQQEHLRALVTRLRQLTDLHRPAEPESFGHRRHRASAV
jgi:transposase